MADNIASFAGHAQFAYLDDTPWHRTGENVLAKMRAASPAERMDVAMAASGMNYTVGSEPIFLADGRQLAGHKASVRYNADGTVGAVFGPVGDRHQHMQNGRILDIARPLVEQFGMVPATMGVLGQGERAFGLFRMADATISPVPGDDVRGYFLLHWGHDGQLAVSGLGSTIRVVCQNTLGMALSASRGKSWFAIRHTTSADARLDQAAKLMVKLSEALQQTGDTFGKLARTPMNAAQVKAYIEAVIPAVADSKGNIATKFEERRKAIARLLVAGRGAEMASQLVPAGQVSAWAMYNAVTEYWDHCRPAEAKSDSGKQRAAESALFGANAENKTQALTLARQLVMA